MPIAIRQANIDDLDATIRVEHGAFPSALAASKANIKKRLTVFPQGFIVAVTDEGQIVGHIMSGATNKDDISDEALKALEGHDPNGKNLVIFAVAVLPEYQGQGIASHLMRHYIDWAQEHSHIAILLICKTHLIKFYESFGFETRGVSASTHGGAQWYEMQRIISKKEA